MVTEPSNADIAVMSFEDALKQLEKIVAALNGLSPACRRAFRLHKFDGLSHVEVAAVMGISRSAIEKHVSAALKHLIREARE